MNYSFLRDIQAEVSSERPRLDPQARLLISIFVRALRDFLCPETKLSRMYRDSAKDYFRPADPKDYGTLAHFCDFFGLSYEETKRMAISREAKRMLKTSGKRRRVK